MVHYTDGYGGNYNYKTICGKEINSHDETETHSLIASQITCDNCKQNNDFKTDLEDIINHNPAIKRRIYIESDILHASELRSAQREVAGLCKQRKENYVRRVFTEVLEYAWHDLEKTWQAVKLADEIYSDSSLLPLCGNSYMGAPVIFNGMCERAIKENVTGKDVYLLRTIEDIDWDMIKLDLMGKAFKDNKLFTKEPNKLYSFTQVDIKKLIAKIKKER